MKTSTTKVRFISGAFAIRSTHTKELRKCRFCGYGGRDWADDDQCPSCGEVN